MDVDLASCFERTIIVGLEKMYNRSIHSPASLCANVFFAVVVDLALFHHGILPSR